MPGRVSTTPPDRVAYARDLWPRGLITLSGGSPAPHPPDAVAWPDLHRGGGGDRARGGAHRHAAGAVRRRLRSVRRYAAGARRRGRRSQAHALDRRARRARRRRHRRGRHPGRAPRARARAPRLHARPLPVLDHVLDVRRLAGGALRRAVLDEVREDRRHGPTAHLRRRAGRGAHRRRRGDARCRAVDRRLRRHARHHHARDGDGAPAAGVAAVSWLGLPARRRRLRGDPAPAPAQPQARVRAALRRARLVPPSRRKRSRGRRLARVVCARAPTCRSSPPRERASSASGRSAPSPWR